jgi:crotonobetainyl-CoA:carnitine CoA-transferase CaiB-like acyl-CoA transferase
MELGADRFKTVASPLRLSATPVRTPSTAPALGEDTDALLQEAGYVGDEIAQMRVAGVIR